MKSMCVLLINRTVHTMNNQQLCATAIIVNDKKEIVLCKRAMDDDFLPGEWDLPGGGMEPGENLEDGLFREVFEELGIAIEIIKEVGTSEYQMGDIERLETVFMCKPLSLDIDLSPEHSEYKWLLFSEIDQIKPGDYIKKLLSFAAQDLT
jgi:mutator protein MutT